MAEEIKRKIVEAENDKLQTEIELIEEQERGKRLRRELDAAHATSQIHSHALMQAEENSRLKHQIELMGKQLRDERNKLQLSSEQLASKR